MTSAELIFTHLFSSKFRWIKVCYFLFSLQKKNGHQSSETNNKAGEDSWGHLEQSRVILDVIWANEAEAGHPRGQHALQTSGCGILMGLVGTLLKEHIRNAPPNSCMIIFVFLNDLPSELGCHPNGLRRSSPHGTPFERHWRHFPHATEIPSCSTRGLCLKDKPKRQQWQAGGCGLPQCSEYWVSQYRGTAPVLHHWFFLQEQFMKHKSPKCCHFPLPVSLRLQIST